MDFDKYQNTKPPRRKDSEINEKVGEIRKSFVGTYDEISAEIERVKEEAEGRFKEEREEYYLEGRRLEDQFKKDLEADFGLENNPKKDQLWKLAWERGHSNGLSEVYAEYAELSSLID